MATTKQKLPDRDDDGKFVADDDRGLPNFKVLAGAVAGGAALGIMAMLGRKAAVQAPTMLAGDWDEALAAEHSAVLKIFDAIEATDERNTTKRTVLLTQLKHALMKHAVEEENVIYARLADDDETSAHRLNEEHGDVKRYLYTLDTTPRESGQWIATVRRFRADIEKHMKEEEQHLFPALKARLTPEENKKLTSAMNREGFKVA